MSVYQTVCDYIREVWGEVQRGTNRHYPVPPYMILALATEQNRRPKLNILEGGKFRHLLELEDLKLTSVTERQITIAT